MELSFKLMDLYLTNIILFYISNETFFLTNGTLFNKHETLCELFLFSAVEFFYLTKWDFIFLNVELFILRYGTFESKKF
jgi:hypothetical protein